MEIHKIINNNVAVTFDDAHKEKIIMGKGICFGKRVGDIVPLEQIEKEFVLVDDEIRERFKIIASEVNVSCLEIAEQIIQRSIKVLDKKLNENIYVSLTDHIAFAINRFHHHMQLKSDMLWYVKKMYPLEYQIGEEALGLIEQEFGIRLIEDECSFIALHIISAEINEDIAQVKQIAKIAKDIETIVKNHFSIHLDKSSVDYFRFITHLKFLAQRIVNNKGNNALDEEDELFSVIRTGYPKSYACAQKIGIYLKNQWEHEISKDELIYLTIHMNRIV